MGIPRITLAIALCVPAVPLAAREHKDVIIMKNGDRITGEIKALESGVLRVDLDYIDGAVSLQWSKVVRVESPQLFIVQMQDGSVYTGALVTDKGTSSERMLTIRQDEPGELNVSVNPAQVVKVSETSATFLQRLSGDVNLGVVYSKGNNATQYNLGSEIEYRRERWGAEGSFTSNLSANSGSNTATHNQINLDTYRLMKRKNYYYGAFGSFLQSSVQGINLQTTLGVGVGRYIKNTNRVRLSVLGGPVWQRAKYDATSISEATKQQTYGGAAVVDLDVFIFKKMNLSTKAMVAPAFSDWGRVHTTMDTSLYWKICCNLSWNLTFYGNWDSKPPPTLIGSDYGYSSGLKWTFGYK